MKIIKETKYGFQTDEGLVYATKEVKDLLKNNLPCEIEVIETKPYGKSKTQIAEIKIIPKKLDISKNPIELTRPKIDAGNILNLAVELYKLDKTKSLHSICEELIKEFKYLETELK